MDSLVEVLTYFVDEFARSFNIYVVVDALGKDITVFLFSVGMRLKEMEFMFVVEVAVADTSLL